MTPLDHITELSAKLAALQTEFQQFADEHMNESWLDSVWKRLCTAFDDDERIAALNEAQGQYERLRFVKENQDD
jgi:hypothetical protein